MKVKRMIEELLKCNPEAEVKLHGKWGNNALFVLSYVGDDKNIVIADKDDADLASELEARYERACKEQTDELDFYMDLFESGITLEDIRENLPEKYEQGKKFCEEHGLV